MPRFLLNKERIYEDVEHRIVNDMHTRKQMMFDESDAFIVLPGGIGTLEEVIEIMTWAQLGQHTKPIVLANINGFWDPLSTLLDHMRDAGFIHTAHRVRPLIIGAPDAIVPAILAAAGEHGEGDARGIERL